MAALILKQIERGSVAFAAADVTQTVTLATTLSDTTKTILLFSASSGSATSIDYQILGRVLSTTQIQFERQAVTPATASNVEYQVIEFVQGITVQHIYQTNPLTTTNITITTVDLAKTFPIVSFNVTGATFGADDLISAEITTTTNLQLVMGGSSSTDAAAVQVVQIDDASVQVIKGALGSDDVESLTVTTITENKTFWLFSLNTSSAGYTFDSLPYLSYINSTTLRFTRALATLAANLNYITYVVSLSAGVTVQNISTVIASSGNTVSPTITAVTVKDTALLLNGLYQRFSSINAANDDAGGNMMALSNLTSTAFTATRTDSPALAATANVQVLNFVGYPTSVSLINDE